MILSILSFCLQLVFYFGEAIVTVASGAYFVSLLPFVFGVKLVRALAALQLGPIVGIAPRHLVQFLVPEFRGLIRVFLFFHGFVHPFNLVFQQGPQQRQGFLMPQLRRAVAEAQHSGNFGKRQAVIIAQYDDVRQLRRQRFQRRGQLVQRFFA